MYSMDKSTEKFLKVAESYGPPRRVETFPWKCPDCGEVSDLVYHEREEETNTPFYVEEEFCPNPECDWEIGAMTDLEQEKNDAKTAAYEFHHGI